MKKPTCTCMAGVAHNCSSLIYQFTCHKFLGSLRDGLFADQVTKPQTHNCMAIHAIKSHRIWPIWKTIPIRIFSLTDFLDHLKTHFLKK